MGIPPIPISNCIINSHSHGMGMGIDDTVGNGKELESPYGNGNGPYSHGNKFPPADAVFSLCNSNVQFIMTFIFYYDNSAFDDNSAPLNRNC